MEQWRQGARAVLRGMGFSVLFGLATLGASSLVPRVLPQPWGMFAFIAFVAAAVRAWPLVPKGSWWEEAWAYGVVLLALLTVGLVLNQGVLAVGATVAGIAVLASHLAARRRLGSKPVGA